MLLPGPPQLPQGWGPMGAEPPNPCGGASEAEGRLTCRRSSACSRRSRKPGRLHAVCGQQCTPTCASGSSRSEPACPKHRLLRTQIPTTGQNSLFLEAGDSDFNCKIKKDVTMKVNQTLKLSSKYFKVIILGDFTNHERFSGEK